MKNLIMLAALAREKFIEIQIRSEVNEEGLTIFANDCKTGELLYNKRIFDDVEAGTSLLEILKIVQERKENKEEE